MATQLFLLDGVTGAGAYASAHRGTNTAKLNGSTSGWAPFALSQPGTRGSGLNAVSVNTVAGPTSGLEVQDTTFAVPIEWLSEPVSADVTISGTITANIWAAEANMTDNAAINVVIDIVRATDNSIVNIVKSTRTTELGTGARAAANFTTGMTSGAYSSQTVNRGDRLRIRVFADDAGTMGSGGSVNVGYNGTSAAADGDTYVQFTETFSFESAPGGTTLYLTDTQSGLSGAPTLISDFTGADENPLSEGGNWANLNSSANPLKRISNAVAGSNPGDSGSYWTPANFGPDLDAYVTISTVSGADNSAVALRVQGEGGANTWDGYLFAFTSTTAAIYRIDNAVGTSLVSASLTISSGDKLGARCKGSTVQIWRQASGSSDWNLLASAVDTTYSSAGKLALFVNNTTVRMDDFYAATNSNLFTQQAWTSRGAGVVNYVSPTVAGWTAPLLTQDWYTKQLTAFTLGGQANANIRVKESAASTRASVRLEIAVVDSDGTSPTIWGSWCKDGQSPAGTVAYGEVDATTETAYTIECSGDDLSVSDGQRLRLRLYVDDSASHALVTGRTVTFYYNGTSGGASGDSYIILPQTVTEFVAAGLVLEQGFVNFNNPGVL